MDWNKSHLFLQRPNPIISPSFYQFSPSFTIMGGGALNKKISWRWKRPVCLQTAPQIRLSGPPLSLLCKSCWFVISHNIRKSFQQNFIFNSAVMPRVKCLCSPGYPVPPDILYHPDIQSHSDIRFNRTLGMAGSMNCKNNG